MGSYTALMPDMPDRVQEVVGESQYMDMIPIRACL